MKDTLQGNIEIAKMIEWEEWDDCWFQKNSTEVVFLDYDLPFDKDWNWLHYAITFIENKFKVNVKITSFWITITTTVDSTIDFTELNIPHSQLNGDMNKIQATFYALTEFAKKIN